MKITIHMDNGSSFTHLIEVQDPDVQTIAEEAISVVIQKGHMTSAIKSIQCHTDIIRHIAEDFQPTEPFRCNQRNQNASCNAH
jgi:hypothetical protein